MLYREIIAVCSRIHTKYINALWTEHKISEWSWALKGAVYPPKLHKPPRPNHTVNNEINIVLYIDEK